MVAKVGALIFLAAGYLIFIGMPTYEVLHPVNRRLDASAREDPRDPKALFWDVGHHLRDEGYIVNIVATPRPDPSEEMLLKIARRLTAREQAYIGTMLIFDELPSADAMLNLVGHDAEIDAYIKARPSPHLICIFRHAPGKSTIVECRQADASWKKIKVEVARPNTYDYSNYKNLE